MKGKLFILFAMFGTGLSGKAQTNENDSIMTRNDLTENKLNALESIAKGVRNGYLFIENGVVKGYKDIENGVVKGFTAVTDGITLKLFGRDGETMEETKERLNAQMQSANNHSREIVEKDRKTTEERQKNVRIK